MTPRRILVTGATGFIGASVAMKLRVRGHSLALLLRSAGAADRAAALYPDCELITGDLAQPESYAVALQAFRPEMLVHTAWDGVAGADRNDVRQIDNISAASALLEQAIAAGTRHFVGLGSQAEYGPHNARLDETAPTLPTTLYGHAKLATCLVTGAMCRMAGVRHIWLRVFSTYGPRDNPQWMIPSLILALRAGQTPALTGGEQKWDYLYIDDAAEAVVAVVENTSACGIFNLGSGQAPPLRDIITILRDAVAPGAALGFGQIPYRPDQVMHLEADIGRLSHSTGWSPRVDLAAGLEKTARWFSERKA